MAWVSKGNGDLFLRRPRQSASETLAHHADDPVIASPVLGDGPVVLAWESRHDKSPRIAMRIFQSTAAH
jgi:hypothetical protein